jgi:hypothetical protein
VSWWGPYCFTMAAGQILTGLITVKLWHLDLKKQRALNVESVRREHLADRCRQLQLYREMDHYTCRVDSRRVWCVFGSPHCPWKPVTPRDLSQN